MNDKGEKGEGGGTQQCYIKEFQSPLCYRLREYLNLNFKNLGAKPNTVSLWAKILCTNYLLSQSYIWILIFSCFIIYFQSIYLFICPISTCTSSFWYCPVLTSVVSPRSWRNQFHGMANNKDFKLVLLCLDSHAWQGYYGEKVTSLK